MKEIYLNLKRFDLPPGVGGVNRLAPMDRWAQTIINAVKDALIPYEAQARFTAFFPETHLLSATLAAKGSPLLVGCQGIHRADTAPGGNFGAFTSLRTGNAMAAAGCTAALVGHCEERREKWEVITAGGGTDKAAVSRLLGQSVAAAVAAGLRVLYCIGEEATEQDCWQETLSLQLELGLGGIDPSMVSIAYEPIWAIGPGKTPPDRAYIQKIAQFVKEKTGGLPLVYGGGLKADNAEMLASIPEIDGGLIALTRFSGKIGFYPEEYLEIISLYLN